jgi:hypothetical protein
MKREIWVNSGTRELPSYNFRFSENWTADQKRKEINKMFRSINELRRNVKSILPGWLRLVGSLPDELYDLLVSELQEGNQLLNICSVNWPNIGSVVGTLKYSIHKNNKKSRSHLVWRELNDPHYCNEEMSQNFNGIEYLIIA